MRLRYEEKLNELNVRCGGEVCERFCLFHDNNHSPQCSSSHVLPVTPMHLSTRSGMPYLDVIRRLRDASSLPIAAYQVSGEYAMLKAAAQKVSTYVLKIVRLTRIGAVLLDRRVGVARRVRLSTAQYVNEIVTGMFGEFCETIIREKNED